MKIISGGQTGADRGGLEGAKRAGVETGGTAPLNYYTERGNDPSLSDFGLVECTRWGYPARTEANVKNSDGTVLFADKDRSTGTLLTIKLCKENNKPYILNPSIEELRKFSHDKGILNIAGNRESVVPGLQQRVSDTMYKLLSEK